MTNLLRGDCSIVGCARYGMPCSALLQSSDWQVFRMISGNGWIWVRT